MLYNKLNEEEINQSELDTEYHVSFPVDTNNISLDELQIELNSNIGDLPFILDDTRKPNTIFVTIGFNDNREAAEINELVCNLMFGGSIDDYTREAEWFYYGNVEALGLPVSLTEGVFDSYKNGRMSQEEKKEKLRKDTIKIINDDLKEKVRVFVSDILKNNMTKIVESMRKDSPNNNDTLIYLHENFVEVFPRISSNECAIVISCVPYAYDRPLIDGLHDLKYMHIYNDSIFDFLDNLEKILNAEFDIQSIIRLKISNGKKEYKLLDRGSHIILGKKVSIPKFVKFVNRFINVNSSECKSNSYLSPRLYIDRDVLIDNQIDYKEYPWAKSFILNTKNIDCKNSKTSFNILKLFLQ